jgi:uncharacterized protein
MKAIKTPLTFAKGTIATVSDIDSIVRQKITDVIVTRPGERVMRPEYGAGLYNLLFDYPDSLAFADFKVDALSDIAENVSGAAIVDLDILPATDVFDETTMSVVASYQIPPTSVRSLTIDLGTPVLNEEEFFS